MWAYFKSLFLNDTTCSYLCSVEVLSSEPDLISFSVLKNGKQRGKFSRKLTTLCKHLGNRKQEQHRKFNTVSLCCIVVKFYHFQMSRKSESNSIYHALAQNVDKNGWKKNVSKIISGEALHEICHYVMPFKCYPHSRFYASKWLLFRRMTFLLLLFLIPKVFV